MSLGRRRFVQTAACALPATLTWAQDAVTTSRQSAAEPVLVPAGEDREGKVHAVGMSATTYKVLTAETGGALFVLEQMNHRKGGPNRHLHHGEDELFYVLEGEYLVEVGGKLLHLRAGDCVLGPRGVPHAWAFVGETTGRLQLTYAPAGRMEAFFNERERLGIKPGAYAQTASDAEVLRRFGMELTGPPLKVS